MLPAILFLSLMCVAMPVSDAKYPPDEEETSDTFCEHDKDGSGIETFSAAFYAAMVTKHGFDVVAGIEVPGPDAANSEYTAVYEVLDAAGLCDAAMIAFTASRPFVSMKKVPLAVYLEKTSHNMGEFLAEKGVLDCSTAIPLAFDLFNLVCKDFDGLDEDTFGSYQQAVLHGKADFLREHGFVIKDVASDLADKFFKSFSQGKNCTMTGR